MRLVLGDINQAAKIVADAINESLEGGPVLLLVSGGSNVELATSVRVQITLKNSLAVGLTDERYGPPGHTDSNWKSLLRSGFDTNNIHLLPVLTGKSLEETARQYDQKLRETMKNSKLIGLFGMGSDGHTSGVLPNSPAVNSQDLVTSYSAADFQRITTTPASFRFFDIAVLAARGGGKRDQLQRLANQAVPVDEQPAQALKQAKQLIVINDQIGERQAV